MNPKERAQKCIEVMLERLKAIFGDMATLEALMVLYQDAVRSMESYKYGPMDAAAAYRAMYRFMQALEELARVESMLDDVKHTLQAISDDLYGEK